MPLVSRNVATVPLTYPLTRAGVATVPPPSPLTTASGNLTRALYAGRLGHALTIDKTAHSPPRLAGPAPRGTRRTTTLSGAQPGTRDTDNADPPTYNITIVPRGVGL